MIQGTLTRMLAALSFHLKSKQLRKQVMRSVLIALIFVLVRHHVSKVSLGPDEPYEIIPSGSDSHLVDLSAFPFPWRENLPHLGPSYAGLESIRKAWDYEASLFYWFFPCQAKNDAPLLVWLQGGPLASSMIGLFYELGPLRVNFRSKDIKLTHDRQNLTIKDFQLSYNPYSWSKLFNIVFVDQPVGTGYSFVKSTNNKSNSSFNEFDHARKLGWPIDKGSLSSYSITSDGSNDYKNGYVTNQHGVSKDFIIFLKKFYRRFPSMRDVGLTISSESYGGKYVPSISNEILSYNLAQKDPSERIPLKSFTIGNQWTDPFSQMATNPSQLLFFGLISPQQLEIANKMVKRSQEMIDQERWLDALDIRMNMFDLLSNFTGDIDWFDVRLKNKHLNQSPMNQFLRLKEVKKLLHVPTDQKFGKDQGMMDIFNGDIMKSTKHLFPRLFKNYKVLLYQGNMDLRDGVVSNDAWLSHLNWTGLDGFNKSPRKIWISANTGEIHGYVNQFENLTRVVLLGCGHRVPADDGCPESSLEMIKLHIEQNSFI